MCLPTLARVTRAWMMRRRPVLALAVLSRLVALSVAVLSDWLLPDHSPEGALVHSFPPGCRHAALFAPFTRWDAAHFLSLVESGWTAEYSHAFFPLYPWLVRTLVRVISPVFATLLCTAELAVLAGVIVSNVAFVVAACSLHALGERVLRDTQLARAAALVFCVSPASVFFSTAYSDATFAAFTFGGMVLLEGGAPWRAAWILACATACRANGTLNALLLAYQGMRRLAHVATPASALQHSGSQLAFARELLSVVAQLAIVQAPYVGWQWLGYWRVCASSRAADAASRALPTPTRVAYTSASTLPAGWCDRFTPDLYAHVQSTYWGVGLFEYYSFRQLPNFALAAPALALCASGCWASYVTLRARYGSLPLRELVARGLGLGPRRSERPATGDGARTPRALPYMAQWLVLSLICLLVANVQVTTRIVCAACPPVYWRMAHVLLRRGGSDRLRAWMLAYLGVFTIVGTALHSNGFPWT